MSALHLHNSLTGKKEAFAPIDPAHVRVYACGPTVYSYAHIGNARMAVVFDLLVRLLRRDYPKVTYVSNITDVDDKIIAASAGTGEDIAVLTRRFERIYNDDMAALGCAAPDVQPRATEHIAEMIAMIGTLVAGGHAYEANGHVLFHVPSFPAYGRLSNRSRDDQIAGARVEVAPYKRDPADFVLWKPSTGDQPGWDSPWGFGRPGWHIECSAMAEKHLGFPFDIHGGGADLKFPHHENEIAQSCCAHGHENDPAAFARVWVHNGFVTVEGEKMSKSLGNFTLAHDLLESYPSEVLRIALLSGHYSQPLDWSENLLVQSQGYLNGLYRTLYELNDIVGKEASNDDLKPFLSALLDDLNTPMAIANLNLIRTAAKAAEIKEDKEKFKGLLIAAGKILGILEQEPSGWLKFIKNPANGENELSLLLAERQTARARKDFERADEIRDKLAALGYRIEDTAAGPEIRRI